MSHGALLPIGSCFSWLLAAGCCCCIFGIASLRSLKLCGIFSGSRRISRRAGRSKTRANMVIGPGYRGTFSARRRLTLPSSAVVTAVAAVAAPKSASLACSKLVDGGTRQANSRLATWAGIIGANSISRPLLDIAHTSHDSFCCSCVSELGVARGSRGVEAFVVAALWHPYLFATLIWTSFVAAGRVVALLLTTPLQESFLLPFGFRSGIMPSSAWKPRISHSSFPRTLPNSTRTLRA